jgi:hypothetical protein
VPPRVLRVVLVCAGGTMDGCFHTRMAISSSLISGAARQRKRGVAQHSRGVWYCPGIGCRLVDSCSTISALDCYPAAAVYWRRRLGGESDLGRSRAVAAEVQRAAVLGPTSSHPLCCCGNIAATSASTSAELRSTH